jgi:acyl-CoA oxidase
MQTTATFDPSTQQFIMHTPSVEACKIWIGNMGQMATHAVVFAQLHTPDKVNHGKKTVCVPEKGSEI